MSVKRNYEKNLIRALHLKAYSYESGNLVFIINQNRFIIVISIIYLNSFSMVLANQEKYGSIPKMDPF